MYRPNNVPASEKELPAFLNEELWRIAREWMTADDAMFLKILHVAPSKTMEGMIVLADGVDWNPGSGQGMYRFQGGSWKFVG